MIIYLLKATAEVQCLFLHGWTGDIQVFRFLFQTHVVKIPQDKIWSLQGDRLLVVRNTARFGIDPKHTCHKGRTGFYHCRGYGPLMFTYNAPAD